MSDIDEVLARLRAQRQPEDPPEQLTWRERGLILAEIDSLRAQEGADRKALAEARKAFALILRRN